MTLQWTVVAFFFYTELAVNIFLCIAFISPQRWHLVFSWRIWNWLFPYWNKCSITMLLFSCSPSNPSLDDHIHVKLFGAQRNLYASGFSLVLWIIMRRVVTLLNPVAVTLENNNPLCAVSLLDDKKSMSAKKKKAATDAGG
uniref:Endoplasmic reticulum transmembrane protein n=1 Tax=Monopterus albus TaxID=43700 RepID=A0A3Q3JB64_MONAL